MRGYRTPAPPLRGGPRDSLCDDDEVGKDVDPFVRRRHCPHELWLALDLDSYIVGDGDLEEERENNKAWKQWKGRYYDSDRFTLRVSWPGSVSRRPSRKLSLALNKWKILDVIMTLTCDPC